MAKLEETIRVQRVPLTPRGDTGKADFTIRRTNSRRLLAASAGTGGAVYAGIDGTIGLYLPPQPVKTRLFCPQLQVLFSTGAKPSGRLSESASQMHFAQEKRKNLF